MHFISLRLEKIYLRMVLHIWRVNNSPDKKVFSRFVKLKMYRSSRPEVFLVKAGVLEISCKFTGEHPCRSVISIKLLWNFIEIVLRHGCSAVYLLHIFRTPFPKTTSGWLLLNVLLKVTLSRRIRNLTRSIFMYISHTKH